jgi:MarR family transcriptional regulator, transcriptional regulator for hemolysin
MSHLSLRYLTLRSQCIIPRVPATHRPPIGLALNRAARIVGRAFDEALTEADGSLPVWLVLLNVQTNQASTQRSLAAALGLREPTLSHHLAAMEADGLITRRRDDANRRVQVVALTDAGQAQFRRLRRAAIAFDRRLRRDIDDADLALVDETLGRLTANVS